MRLLISTWLFLTFGIPLCISSIIFIKTNSWQFCLQSLVISFIFVQAFFYIMRHIVGTEPEMPDCIFCANDKYTIESIEPDGNTLFYHCSKCKRKYVFDNLDRFMIIDDNNNKIPFKKRIGAYWKKWLDDNDSNDR